MCGSIDEEGEEDEPEAKSEEPAKVTTPSGERKVLQPALRSW